jgi:hypothetical protein
MISGRWYTLHFHTCSDIITDARKPKFYPQLLVRSNRLIHLKMRRSIHALQKAYHH